MIRVGLFAICVLAAPASLAQELPLPDICSSPAISVEAYAAGAEAEGWSRLSDPAAIREAANVTAEPLTASETVLGAFASAEDLDRFQAAAAREAEQWAGRDEVAFLARDDRYLMIMAGVNVTFAEVTCVVAAADLPEIDAFDLTQPDFIYPVAFRSHGEEVGQPLGGQLTTLILTIDAPEDLASRLHGRDGVISQALLAHDFSFEQLQEALQ